MDPEEIRKKIQDGLNKGSLVPDSKTIAFITHADVDAHGKVTASAVFAMRVQEHWQVSSVIDWSHDTGVKAGVNVIYSK